MNAHCRFNDCARIWLKYYFRFVLFGRLSYRNQSKWPWRMHCILMCYALLTIAPLIGCNRIFTRAKTLSESAKSWQLIDIICTYYLWDIYGPSIFNFQFEGTHAIFLSRLSNIIIYKKRKSIIFTNNSVKFWILWERNNFFKRFFFVCFPLQILAVKTKRNHHI